MEDKYTILKDQSIKVNGINVYRIKALKDFKDVEAGDLGGYIESACNLSQQGDCWIYGDAIVQGDAKVYGNAMIRDNARVAGDAKVYGNACVCCESIVSDSARIYSEAIIADNATIYGEAKVYGHSFVCSNAMIFGHVEISDDAIVMGAYAGEQIEVYGDARIFPGVKLKGNKRIGSGIVLQ